MKPNYKLGNMILKWDESWEEWHGIDLDGEVHCFRSLRAIKDAGGVAIENESECECKPNSTDKCDTCVMGMGWEDEKPEREEPQTTRNCGVKMPRIIEWPFSAYGDGKRFRDWMQQVTDMLNRHEQVLREVK
jgi:hypothetical protein